ncbi:MAG: methyltransferase domain-containing protein [Acidimicrobiia bacterium]|nr:methyltransferase domain-containing protein [Acidimicrobiia bacterium]
MTGPPDSLIEVLENAREIGLLGPGPIETHMAHSLAWADALGDFDGQFLDLGCGGGVPGLVLCWAWPAAQAVLLDASKRRVAFLGEAAEKLGMGGRVRVIAERAEIAGKDPNLREQFDLVVSRGFGSPGTTAECAAPFVRVGGRISVSEPPGGQAERWPVAGLEQFCLENEAQVVQGDASFVILRKYAVLDPRWPRRDGRPHKRPAW